MYGSNSEPVQLLTRRAGHALIRAPGTRHAHVRRAVASYWSMTKPIKRLVGPELGQVRASQEPFSRKVYGTIPSSFLPSFLPTRRLSRFEVEHPVQAYFAHNDSCLF